MNTLLRRVFLVALLALLLPAWGHAEDRKLDHLQFLSTEPSSPGELAIGDPFYVRIAYRLQSAEEVRIYVDTHLKSGDRLAGSWPGSDLFGKGEDTLLTSWTYSDAVHIDAIEVTMVAFDPRRTLAKISHSIDIRWVDKNPTIDPNPLFADVYAVDVNFYFPAGRKIYRSLLDMGVKRIAWFDNCSPKRWEVAFGTEVSVQAAQTVLSACLKASAKIDGVKVRRDRRNPSDARITRGITIGALDVCEDCPTLAPEAVERMLDPDITSEELHKLMEER